MLFSSCDDGFDCFKSTGKTITEQRLLPVFNKIDLSDNVDLNIEYGITMGIISDERYERAKGELLSRWAKVELFGHE